VFYEFKDENGHVTPLTTAGQAPTNGYYGVLSIENAFVVMGGGRVLQNLSKEDYDAEGMFATAERRLVGASFVSEKLDTDDYFPGIAGVSDDQKCAFTNAYYRVKASGVITPTFSDVHKTPSRGQTAGQLGGTGTFTIWDTRPIQ
jgi:hypothetical protein